MKRTRNPLYRCAERARWQLTHLNDTRSRQFGQRLAQFGEACNAVARRTALAKRADQRGWDLAAQRLRTQVAHDFLIVQETSAEILRIQNHSVDPIPALSLLIDELVGLQLEFEDVVFDPQQSQISVRTEPLVLEEQHLGPFSIELHLDRLSDSPGSQCFDCVALDPNPAESNSSITHPHVKDDRLCAGDATLPISLALSQSRLGDAFVLVAGVLRHYNSSSPYVSLDDWNGTSCPDCGEVTSRDDLYYCEGCDRDVCDNCSGHCDLCDSPVCRSCLERDPISGNNCCADCRDRQRRQQHPSVPRVSG
jgi:hypothetical protein